MSEYKLGVIGAGKMAEAVLRGAVGNGFLPGAEITAFDPEPSRKKLLEKDPGIVFAENNHIPAACPHLLLAVKPDVAPGVLEEIASTVSENTAVISIVAGLSGKTIDEKLGGKTRIVRVMPNTPMLVRAGVSAVSAGPRAVDGDIKWTCNLLESGGRTVVVDETLMDAVTGLSGSGPAYFFYMVEAMVAAGTSEGIDPETARTLAVQTCIGAGKLLAETGKSPEVLREQVTTPGGTTQKGIETMEAADVGKSITAAVRAAAERSRELGITC